MKTLTFKSLRIYAYTHKAYTYLIIYSTGPQPPGSNNWWSGDDIIIKIKCTINLIYLNHLKTILPKFSPWKNCPPYKQSLVPKRLGTVGQRITFIHLNLQILKIWEKFKNFFNPRFYLDIHIHNIYIHMLCCVHLLQSCLTLFFFPIYFY